LQAGDFFDEKCAVFRKRHSIKIGCFLHELATEERVGSGRFGWIRFGEGVLITGCGMGCSPLSEIPIATLAFHAGDDGREGEEGFVQ
jgi:hypothetical protein